MNHGIVKGETLDGLTGRASPPAPSAAPRGFPVVSLPSPSFDAPPPRDVDLEGVVFGVASVVVIVGFLSSFVLLEGGGWPMLGLGLGAGSVALLFVMGRWAFHRL
jgi:hypothetical protein